MKDCAYYQELISRLVDREITPEEGEELAAHARECEECRAVYTAFVSLSDTLCAGLVDPPEELAENVMAEIRRAELWKQNRRPRRQMRRWAALAASAVLVIGVGALTLPRLLGAKGAAKPFTAPRRPRSPQPLPPEPPHTTPPPFPRRPPRWPRSP